MVTIGEYVVLLQRFLSRLSGNWDASTLKLDELQVADVNSGVEDMSRRMSVPVGKSPKAVRRTPSNSQVAHAADDATLIGHSSDDWAAHGELTSIWAKIQHVLWAKPTREDLSSGSSWLLA